MSVSEVETISTLTSSCCSAPTLLPGVETRLGYFALQQILCVGIWVGSSKETARGLGLCTRLVRCCCRVLFGILSDDDQYSFVQ